MVSRVLIVDDSVIARSALKQIISEHPDFEVIGTAADPFEAREMIIDDDPDMLTLDVEMPRLDGLTFLERIMEHHPMPVVMVSSLTESTSRKGMKALEMGAVDVVGKPAGDTRDSIKSLKEDLIPKLEAAARASLGAQRGTTSDESEKGPDIDLPDEVNLIVFGASTGGTKAMLKVFRELPEGLPPIMIAQHMPETFTKQFAAHLDEEASFPVFEAEEEGYVDRSEAVLAQGDRHLLVDGKPRGGRVHYTTNQEEEVCFQRPAVDPLFESAARFGNGNVVGVVLTGMGKDGREGSKALSDAGSPVIVQDEESCTVYGMPKQVKENVATAQEVSLDQIADVLSRVID
ncbi:MAG: chemotaxis response regulator protein-glutamate methylesterase [bacterium]